MTTSSAGAKEAANASWNTRRHDEADRGSKTAQIRAPGCDALTADSVSRTAVG